MKKAIGIILILALAITFSVFAAEKEQAETEEKVMMPGADMMQKGMMPGAGMMGGGMGMMKPMPMGKTMVATSDGGVVVMVGNRLYKYDKNLELKKEAEIKMDMPAMKHMIKSMKKKCPKWQEGEEKATSEKEEE